MVIPMKMTPSRIAIVIIVFAAFLASGFLTSEALTSGLGAGAAGGGATGAGAGAATGADATGWGGLAGFLPYSGAFGSQSLFFLASSASWSALRVWPLFRKGTGTLVT